MNSEELFLCKQCGLPIRNREEAHKREESRVAPFEQFTCEQCVICEDINQVEIDELQAKMLILLCKIMNKIYKYRHGTSAPRRFQEAVRDHLKGEHNPSEALVLKIQKAIESGGTDDEMLRQVADSERALSEFSFRSVGNRRSLMNSTTILRHWVALVQRMERLARTWKDPGSVLKVLGISRYDLNLRRLSKLIGDNPVPVIRDSHHYESRPHHLHGTRANHLAEHLAGLQEQAELKKFRPRITDDWKTILRFAGNACFVTEWDEAIEFRSVTKEHKRLCKYLLRDEILIVIDDLWFLDAPGSKRIAELVSVYPKDMASGVLMTQLRNHDYVPNCVDLDELFKLSEQIEKVFFQAPQAPDAVRL